MDYINCLSARLSKIYTLINLCYLMTQCESDDIYIKMVLSTCTLHTGGYASSTLSSSISLLRASEVEDMFDGHTEKYRTAVGYDVAPKSVVDISANYAYYNHWNII